MVASRYIFICFTLYFVANFVGGITFYEKIVNYEADQNGYRPTISYEQTNQGGGTGGAGGYNANAQSNNNKFNGY